jgi:type I restriction enzyme M protein
LQYEEFADCIAWWKDRQENDRAWKVPVDQVLKYDDENQLVSVNLDLKNPSGKDDFEHLPPALLVDDIIAKERAILEILAEIKASLGTAV